MRGTICAVLLVIATPALAAERCTQEDGVVVQVLGSGGPIADDARASSGYIVWVDGQARVLIDAGSGTFLRFGEVGASFADLDFIGLSHFHTDHSADFPALLKSGSFSERRRPLAVAGPDAGGPFPGLAEYLKQLFDAETGAYRYLSGYLDDGNGTGLAVTEVSDSDDVGVTVYTASDGRVAIDALHVPHGIVPALGYRVRAGDRTAVFGSDQNGSDPRFTEFASGADVLVMHMVIPEGVSGPASRLHAAPSRIGEIAAAADPDTLVLSHLMARSLRDLERNVALVRERYSGRIVIAEDLICVRAGTR